VNAINLNIIDDKLSAYISLTESKSHFPSAEEMINYLKKRGVVFGILKDRIEAICRDKEPVIAVLVARGTTPRGRLDWKINLDSINRPVISAQNRADFKNLAPLPYVSKGMPLVTLKDKEYVQEGKNILGEHIPPPAENNELPLFNSEAIERKADTLYSKTTGYLFWDDNTLSVSKVFHVNGDVDYGTGNLKVNGAVVIEGDVRSGFRVEAAGPITIKGTVDAATIYSQNGDIIIGQGIMGQGRARVMCGGSLICGFAQDAQIAVKKNITFESYAINCTVSAGGFVKLSGNNSVIRGGSITANNGIEASNIGSERGVETELILRNTPEDERQAQLLKNSREKLIKTERRFFLEKRQRFLMLLKQSKSGISHGKDKEIKDIRTELERLEAELHDLNKRETELVHATGREIVKKEIIARDALYRNVRIDIGGKIYFTDNMLSKVRVIKIKDEIVIESLAKKYDIFVPGERSS